MNCKNTQLLTGMSLIEVLVSLSILSIGILGLARTQVLAIHDSNAALQATLAVQSQHNHYEETFKKN